MPVYYSTGSIWKAFAWTALAGIAEPLGGLLAFLVLSGNQQHAVYGAVFGLVAGIMTALSLKYASTNFSARGFAWKCRFDCLPFSWVGCATLCSSGTVSAPQGAAAHGAQVWQCGRGVLEHNGWDGHHGRQPSTAQRHWSVNILSSTLLIITADPCAHAMNT